jgi:hypothetical protein
VRQQSRGVGFDLIGSAFAALGRFANDRAQPPRLRTRRASGLAGRRRGHAREHTVHGVERRAPHERAQVLDEGLDAF